MVRGRTRIRFTVDGSRSTVQGAEIRLTIDGAEIRLTNAIFLEMNAVNTECRLARKTHAMLRIGDRQARSPR